MKSILAVISSCYFLLNFSSTVVSQNVNISKYSEDDSTTVYEITPCKDNLNIIEVFDKRNPDYYEVVIIPKNISSSRLKFKLTFDKYATFKQNYRASTYITDSLYLEAIVVDFQHKNISLHVKPFAGVGHPFPNLIGAVIDGITYCNNTEEGQIKGIWDRFIQIEPTYVNSVVNVAKDVNKISQKDEQEYPAVVNSPRLKDGKCGEIVKQHQELIHHGESVVAGSWPWHAAIYRLAHAGGDLKYICGGTLISKFRVLTAGHCVVEKGNLVLPERLSVVLGKVSYLGGDYGLQEKGVFDIILHPDFSINTLENDIAVLKIATEVKFSEYVQPICLPEKDSGSSRSSIFGKYGFVVGWGATRTAKFSFCLKQALLPVRSDLECVRNNPTFFGNFLRDNSFCAGYTNGTAACNGDSGGGFYLEADNFWQLRGIISLGVSKISENSCDPDYYTIFTDVAQHLDFIRAAGALG